MLTVTETVALAATVGASNGSLLGVLHALVGAAARDVAELAAVHAERDTASDGLTAVGQTFKILLGVGRPDSLLTGARGLVLEAERDGVLAVQIALEIHVGEGDREVGALNADEVHANVLVAEHLLHLNIGHLGASLDVHQKGSLDIVKVLLGGSLADHLEGLVGGLLRYIITDDLARGLAILGVVAWLEARAG